MNNHWKGSSFEPSIIWTTPQQYCDDEEILLTKSQSVAKDLCGREKTKKTTFSHLSSDISVISNGTSTSVNSLSSACPCDERMGCGTGGCPSPRLLQLCLYCTGSLSLLFLRMDAVSAGKGDDDSTVVVASTSNQRKAAFLDTF
jgi:hypothetical protein